MTKSLKKGTGANPTLIKESELKLEEYKGFKTRLFFENLIKSVKESVNHILSEEELMENEETISEKIVEIKKDMNNQSIVLSYGDEKKVKNINEKITHLIDEGENLYKEILKINKNINNNSQNAVKLNSVEKRRRLRLKIELISEDIIKLYKQKISIFRESYKLEK